MEYINNKAEKKNKLWIFIVIGIVLAAVAVIVALVIRNLPGNSNEGIGMVTEGEFLTEGEIENTGELLGKYVEVTVEGFNESRNIANPNGAVGVFVKNISDEEISVMLILAAYLDGNEIVDKHFIYAEHLEPGATQNFDAFINTPLTPEELKKATYKVYKAERYTPEDEMDDSLVVEEGSETEGTEEADETENNEAGSSETEPSKTEANTAE